jgi:carbamoyltransferase
LLGADPYGARGHQSAVSRPAAGVRGAEWCTILVNTSFNVPGEPIVCSPERAFRCFMGSEIEVLVAGNCLLRKHTQDPVLGREYRSAFERD